MKTGGRREGEQISLPCLSPFAQRPFGRKREEGRDIFDIRRKLSLIGISQPVRLIWTFSPKASDSQSVTSGLAVRRDGLKTESVGKDLASSTQGVGKLMQAV